MLKLYNTLTRRVEQVEPIEPDLVKMYTCGPTVYRDAHIGNLRSYLMADWARRVLVAQGIDVVQVKNITDVGHMRQEVLERGEDKVVAAAIAEGKTPAEIAQFYTDRFLQDERKLNVAPPDHLPKATDHIGEMLDIVERLVEEGYAYEVEGNVYFEVSKFPAYGKLSGNIHESDLLEGVRSEADPLKRDPRDFTLWKRAEPGRELKWSSPWGDGFPGWHIECSAMSIKYLGKRFDIHTGGVDNVFPHHEGEIAQSEGYTGEPVVNLWLHGQHLLADGVKMAKSLGNSFILEDIESQGIEPLAFRYLCLTASYRTRLNFTFGSLKAAQRALLRLRNRVWEWDMAPTTGPADHEAEEEWRLSFIERVDDDLDLPGALALTWRLARSDFPGQFKARMLREYDQILGLDIEGTSDSYQVPEDIHALIEERSALRQHGRYREADAMREAMDGKGYVVQDTPAGTRVRPKAKWEKRQEGWRTVSSSAEVRSLVGDVDATGVTIAIVACNYMDDVKRCVQSALRWTDGHDAELVVVDNGSTDGTAEWLEAAAASDERITVVHTDHVLGHGAATNIALKRSQGRNIVLVDTSVEIAGDVLGPINDALNDDTIGVIGPFGLRTDDLHHFHEGEGESGEVDAIQAYCFAFRRSRLRDVGLVRESFRFYRNLDLDTSFHFKDAGYKIVAMPSLPVQRHVHRVWTELSDGERDELSHKNYRRFLDKWGHREDLLVVNQSKR